MKPHNPEQTREERELRWALECAPHCVTKLVIEQRAVIRQLAEALKLCEKWIPRYPGPCEYVLQEARAALEAAKPWLEEK